MHKQGLDRKGTLPPVETDSTGQADCHAIKDKHGECCVLCEFIPKKIHQYIRHIQAHGLLVN